MKLISTIIFLLLSISSLAQNEHDKFHFFGDQYIMRDARTGEVTTIKPSVFKAEIWIKEEGIAKNPTLKIKTHSGTYIDDDLIYLDIIEQNGSHWYKYVAVTELSKIILSTHDLSKIGKFKSASKMIRIDDNANEMIFVIGF
tara:strand:+ start:492 stop:917 length:426 start_codon:yes stop_codon:yes gene_type:complete